MKKYLVFALSICLLSACNSGDEPQIPEEPVAITLSAKSLSIDVETKAPYMGSTETLSETPLVARVISTPTAGDYSTEKYSDGNISFAGSENAYGYGSTLSGNAYYPANGSNISLIGLYPTGTVWTTPTTSTVVATFTGKEDLMYAPQHTGLSKATTTPPTLAFSHLLTLLKLSIVAENDAAIAAWGKITSITLSSKNVATVTPTPDNAIVFSGTNATMPFYFLEGDNADIAIGAKATEDGEAITITLTTQTATNIAYAMVAPVNAATSDTADYSLLIKSEKHTEGIAVNIQLMNDAEPQAAYALTTEGKSFNITLTFKSSLIVAKATVAGWTASGGAAVEIK